MTKQHNLTAAEIFSQMTPEEKVGQLIQGRGVFFPDQIEEMIEKGAIGGVGIGRFNSCMENEQTCVDYIAQLRRKAKYPLVITGNSSNGSSSVLRADGTLTPPHMAIAATRNLDHAFEYGRIMGQSMLALGFNMAGCLLLDVLTNHHCYIGTRAFSDDPDLVTKMGRATIAGIRSTGQIELAHHFFCQGDSNVDTHLELGYAEGSLERIEKLHAAPWRTLINEGLRVIETGHMRIPQIDDGEGMLVTVSQKIMTNYLRGDLGFKGLAVTDSLTMKPVKDRFGIEKTAVMAVQAGHDFILHDYDSDPWITHKALVEAFRNGVMPMSELDRKVKSILNCKEEFGLLELGNARYEKARTELDKDQCLKSAKQMAEDAVTRLKGTELREQNDTKTLVIVCCGEFSTQKDLSMSENPLYQNVATALKDIGVDADILQVDQSPTEDEFSQINDIKSKYDQITLCYLFRHIAYQAESSKPNKSFDELLNILGSSGKQISAINFGNPVHCLLTENISHNLLATYSDIPASVQAAFKVLYGKIKARGKLPINLSTEYSFGYGLD